MVGKPGSGGGGGGGGGKGEIRTRERELDAKFNTYGRGLNGHILKSEPI